MRNDARAPEDTMTDDQDFVDVDGLVGSVLEMGDAIAFYARGKLYVLKGVEGPFTLTPAPRVGCTRIGFASAPYGLENVVQTCVWVR